MSISRNGKASYHRKGDLRLNLTYTTKDLSTSNHQSCSTDCGVCHANNICTDGKLASQEDNGVEKASYIARKENRASEIHAYKEILSSSILHFIRKSLDPLHCCSL